MMHTHTPWEITHFVSFDTDKMEIYDPLNKNGAIVGSRDDKDMCLFLEYLNFEVPTVIKTVWILDLKNKRPAFTQLHVHNNTPPKKKRRGKPQIKVLKTAKIDL